MADVPPLGLISAACLARFFADSYLCVRHRRGEELVLLKTDRWSQVRDRDAGRLEPFPPPSRPCPSHARSRAIRRCPSTSLAMRSLPTCQPESSPPPSRTVRCTGNFDGASQLPSPGLLAASSGAPWVERTGVSVLRPGRRTYFTCCWGPRRPGFMHEDGPPPLPSSSTGFPIMAFHFRHRGDRRLGSGIGAFRSVRARASADPAASA